MRVLCCRWSGKCYSGRRQRGIQHNQLDGSLTMHRQQHEDSPDSVSMPTTHSTECDSFALSPTRFRTRIRVAWPSYPVRTKNCFVITISLSHHRIIDITVTARSREGLRYNYSPHTSEVPEKLLCFIENTATLGSMQIHDRDWHEWNVLTLSVVSLSLCQYHWWKRVWN